MTATFARTAGGYTKQSCAAEAFMLDTPMAARRALDDSIAIYGNEDTIMREKALDAICGDRAAYWSMSSYSDAIGSSLPYALNAGVDLSRAVENAYAARQFLKPGALDRIVPLNMAAARALSHAYAREGSWVEESELLMRAKRDCRRAA